MQKSIMSVLVAFAVVLFVSMPAQASSQIDDGFAGTPQSQPLPVFMQGLEFTPMTEAEMAEVRGEAIIDDVVGIAVGLTMSMHISWTDAVKIAWAIRGMYGWSWQLASGSAKSLGWEIGRLSATMNGYPDPGAFYNPSNITQIFPWYIQKGVNFVK